MSARPLTRKLAGVVLASALVLGAAACSSDDKTATDTGTATTDAAIGATDTGATDTAASGNTIVAVAVANPDFSTLVTAVKAAGLVETLEGDGPYTVFAPTDEAFAKVDPATLQELLKPENVDQLKAILTYHVVAGKVMAADLTDGQKVKTVQGEELTVGVAGGKVTLTDAAGNTVTVVKADVPADNGVIHAIDGVLMPTAPTSS